MLSGTKRWKHKKSRKAPVAKRPRTTGRYNPTTGRPPPRAPITEEEVYAQASRWGRDPRNPNYLRSGLRAAARVRTTYRAFTRFAELAMPVVSFMDTFTGGWDQNAYEASKLPTSSAAIPPPGSQTAAPSYDYMGSSTLRPGLQPSYADIADGVPAGSSAPGAELPPGPAGSGTSQPRAPRTRQQ